jgi:hypothetical protein
VGLRRHRVRTDASSVEIEANGLFVAAPAWKWSDTLDMRDFTHLVVFFDPTSVVTVSEAHIVLAWSDDGTTIPFDDEDNFQQSDFNIGDVSDGSFKPKPYTVALTTAGGELVVNKAQSFVYLVKGRFCRVGVNANGTNGAYRLRAQRLVG